MTSLCPTCCTRFDACSECHEKDFAKWDFAIQRLAAENEKLREAQEQWAKEELLAQQGKRENFRTMYCDNCENYQSDKCSRCFSYGYTYPVNFTPAKHFLFKEPHPKDAEIARLRAALEEIADSYCIVAGRGADAKNCTCCIARKALKETK